MLGRVLVACALVVTAPAAAAAQSVYPADWFKDLPAGGNVFALLESAQAEVTTDRFNAGALNAGVAERASAFLASWTQTRYFIDRAPIASPVDGTPMLFPDLALWQSVHASSTGRGLDVSLMPRSPARRAVFELIGSGGALTERPSPSRPPAVIALQNFARIDGVVTAAAADGKLRLAAGGSFARSNTVERNRRLRRDIASGLLNVSFGRHIRALGLVQRQARHFQAAYDGERLTVFSAYTTRTRDADPPPAFQQADRVFDGPIPALVTSSSAERRWSAGSTVILSSTSRHELRAGVAIDGASTVVQPVPQYTIAERVAGVPARIWSFSTPGMPARRHSWVLSPQASARFDLDKGLRLNADVQFDLVAAGASGAATGINWQTLLPSLIVQWQPPSVRQLELKIGVSRFADAPLLALLEHGDPAAPTAAVYRWEEGSTHQPLVMRAGPGTGDAASFSAIDADLKRPVTDQFLLEGSYTPKPALTLRVTGLARRQSSLIGVVNLGAPLDSYTMFTVLDANADWVNPGDDQQLPVYNRKPESFGEDRYLLTNPGVEDATMGAVVVSGEVDRPRVLFRIAGTASASVGAGGNRGFTATENDQSMLGETFSNPNASTYARGRLFNDRAYTIKTLSVFKLPAAITAGIIARYQDGQPFTRVAVVSGLNQGAEAIQAFARGRSRFAFRATLDVRLTKAISLGGTQLDLIGDAYNLLNSSMEVEEYIVTGPRYRETTAVQPPRAFHVGARVTF